MPTQSTSPVASANHSPIFAVGATLAVVAVLGAGIAYYTGVVSVHIPEKQQVAAQKQPQNTAPLKTTMTLGTYALAGRAAGQSGNYAGTVTISSRPNTPNVFDLIWHITSGQAQIGVGILNNDVLSVSYYETAENSAVRDIGVVSYRIVDETHLQGEWTSVQGGTAGVEQLTFQPQI